MPLGGPNCGMMAASKRCSFAGADWRRGNTNYPSIERLFSSSTPRGLPLSGRWIQAKGQSMTIRLGPRG